MVGNVDNIHLFKGLNTFHDMGIITTIKPKVNLSSLVPEKIVVLKFLIETGRIETWIMEKKITTKYQNLEHVCFEESNTISLFGRRTWLLRRRRQMWNGFMEIQDHTQVYHLKHFL